MAISRVLAPILPKKFHINPAPVIAAFVSFKGNKVSPLLRLFGGRRTARRAVGAYTFAST